MKKRTFLTTLLLFLFFFNITILTITTIMLKENINIQKERYLAEHYVIVLSLTKDMQALENRRIDLNSSMEDLMRSYIYFSQDKKTNLLIYQGDQQIFSNISVKDAYEQNFLLTELESQQDRHVSIQGKEIPFLWISGRLPEPYQEYSLIYRHDMGDTFTSWQKMKNVLYLCGEIFSILLAMCLLLLLNRIFRPLDQISKASQSIATGNYKDRLPLSGRDELYNMAHSFNNMAEEIEHQIETLNEVAQQKQCFVDNFAHELRTPLTTIYGYAEYMQKTVVTEEDKFTSTAYIMSECKRMETMAYQLLDLAMLRSGEIESEQISLSELFQQVENSMCLKVSEKQVKISYQNELDSLFGNRNLLESLMINLIDNALKACNPEGNIIVRAYQEHETPTILVQDNGKGMSEEQITHIREAFYRVDKARSRIDGGAGLGLSLCEQIVDFHNATLLFLSTPGVGTIVKISFTTL